MVVMTWKDIIPSFWSVHEIFGDELGVRSGSLSKRFGRVVIGDWFLLSGSVWILGMDMFCTTLSRNIGKKGYLMGQGREFRCR